MKERLTGLARVLRRQQTRAEHTLWRRLRGRQVDGWKFKRQAPHGRYILDFYCADAGLVIEVDGTQHLDNRAEYDAERTAHLEREGLKVLRFWNSEVHENIDGVMEAIYLALGRCQAPSPGVLRRPLPQGRGDAAASGESNSKT